MNRLRFLNDNIVSPLIFSSHEPKTKRLKSLSVVCCCHCRRSKLFPVVNWGHNKMRSRLYIGVYRKNSYKYLIFNVHSPRKTVTNVEASSGSVRFNFLYIMIPKCKVGPKGGLNINIRMIKEKSFKIFFLNSSLTKN